MTSLTSHADALHGLLGDLVTVTVGDLVKLWRNVGNASDEVVEQALKAAYQLTRMEGIIPALESAHALAALDQMKFKPDDIVVVNLSGRGDKDMETYIRHLKDYTE